MEGGQRVWKLEVTGASRLNGSPDGGVHDESPNISGQLICHEPDRLADSRNLTHQLHRLAPRPLARPYLEMESGEKTGKVSLGRARRRRTADLAVAALR